MTPVPPELLGRIHDLILTSLNVEVPAPDTDLIESGLLDSLALVTLIAELEATFERELPLDDFDLECFRSVERIVAFLSCSGMLDGQRNP